MAAGLDPDNAARHEILAELYLMAGPGLLAEGRARAHGAHQARPVPRRELQGAAQALHGHAAVRQGVVHVLGAGVLAARRRATRCSSTSSTSRRASCAPRRGSPTRCGPRTCSTPTRTATSARSSRRCGRRSRCCKSGEHKQFGLKRKDKRDLHDRPGAVLQGVQLRHAGAQHLAAGGLLPARAAGRHAARQHAREAAC